MPIINDVQQQIWNEAAKATDFDFKMPLWHKKEAVYYKRDTINRSAVSAYAAEQRSTTDWLNAVNHCLTGRIKGKRHFCRVAGERPS